MNSQRKKVLLLALALDLLIGDPPNKWHLVAWMGSLISFVMRKRPFNNPKAEFGFGAGLVLLGATLEDGISYVGLSNFHRLCLLWMKRILHLRLGLKRP